MGHPTKLNPTNLNLSYHEKPFYSTHFIFWISIESFIDNASIFMVRRYYYVQINNFQAHMKGVFMKPVHRQMVLAVILSLVFSVSAVAQEPNSSPLLVSPGNESKIAVIEQDCPTFSWTTVDWATGYQVAVFETEVDAKLTYEEIAAMKAPKLFREINGHASSWTPSATEQLSSGQNYLWYVKAIDQYGIGSWSQGRRFKVETPLLPAVFEERLREELKREGLNERSIDEVITTVKSKARLAGSSGVDVGKKSDVPTSPMGYESGTNTFYGLNAGNTVSFR